MSPFLAAQADDPFDPTPMLIRADWLEECGMPLNPISSFLAAQAARPHDPMPMLVWADRVEERGDLAGAEALRGLAAAGWASIAVLACAAAAEPEDDEFCRGFHRPHGTAVGFGRGDRHGNRSGFGPGKAEMLDHLGDGGYGEGLLGIDSAELPG